MEVVIHKIRLRDPALRREFERWVVNSDYVACHKLTSVIAFDVHRVSEASTAPFHYVEIIRVSSRSAFDADMSTPTFKSLESEFSTMADVVEEVAGEQLGDGYPHAVDEGVAE
ncbi:RedY protein [Vreelandella titanicae]|uniref:RedY protein n=1 Tax=Vreelandella titanicae TaxID=664683 RepID=UPI00241F699A|nr:RedY protein [Halomonas titanicae]UEQ05309.1 RedY protein [Halomonas profundus]